jgi:hypothetical protein
VSNILKRCSSADGVTTAKKSPVASNPDCEGKTVSLCAACAVEAAELNNEAFFDLFLLPAIKVVEDACLGS